MIDTNTDLSNRFFYVNPSADSAADLARMFPMSRLIAMNIVDDTNDLRLAFDDSGVGDHTVVQILITANKGKEAIKDIVDAINSHQKVVVLADKYTGESIISDYTGASVSITSGSAGTFTLNGSFSVSGFANFGSRVQYNFENVDGGGSGSATALNPNLTISFVSTDTGETHVTLADGSAAGQIKYIVHKTRTGDNDLVITPASFAAGSNMTSNLGGRGVTLIYDGDDWQHLGDVGEFAIG